MAIRGRRQPFNPIILSSLPAGAAPVVQPTQPAKAPGDAGGGAGKWGGGGGARNERREAVPRRAKKPAKLPDVEPIREDARPLKPPALDEPRPQHRTIIAGVGARLSVGGEVSYRHGRGEIEAGVAFTASSGGEARGRSRWARLRAADEEIIREA